MEHALPSTEQIPPPLTAPDAVVDHDVICVDCGYNLRGLSVTGLCPECGRDIQLSMQGNFLRYANAEWVARVSRGADFVIAGIALASMLSGILFTLLTTGDISAVVFRHLLLSVFVLPTIGLWMLTTLDPVARVGEGLLSHRKIVRFTTLVALACPSAIVFLLSFTGKPVSFAYFIYLTAIGNQLVLVFALVQYLDTLALRIPDQALANMCRGTTRGWGFVAASAGLLTAAVILRANQINVPSILLTFLNAGGGCGALLGALIMSIVTLILLIKTRHAIQDEARLARTNREHGFSAASLTDSTASHPPAASSPGPALGSPPPDNPRG